MVALDVLSSRFELMLGTFSTRTLSIYFLEHFRTFRDDGGGDSDRVREIGYGIFDLS